MFPFDDVIMFHSQHTRFCYDTRDKHHAPYFTREYEQINGFVQDCSISSALAMGILQSWTKPSKYFWSGPKHPLIAWPSLIIGPREMLLLS